MPELSRPIGAHAQTAIADQPESILVVDDNPTNLKVMYTILQELGAKVIAANSGESALKIASKALPSLILLDIMMPPGIDGYETCTRLKQAPATRDIPVIFLSALDDANSKLKGFGAGAVDYVSKPFDAPEVLARVKTHLTLDRLRKQLEDQNTALRHELRVASNLVAHARAQTDGPLIGSSPAVTQLRESIATHGAHARPVLIVGPPGSGHEAVARSLHDQGPRRSRAFIYHSCLGTSSTANEVLFGSQNAGSQPEDEGDTGLWGLAAGGTLCLDQIERMPDAARASLIARLRSASAEDGSGAKPGVRVVALTTSVAAASLDPGLLQALGGGTIQVPGLRERRQDIAELVHYYVRRKAGRMGRDVSTIAEEALRRFAEYSWPGNIEELSRVVESAIAASKGTALELDDALLQAGRRVGSYQLSKKLGEGGMGEVWLAKHRLLVRSAAVKLIRSEQLGTEIRAEAIQRFEREARATAALESPNAVRLYDYGITDDGDLYYVMERLRGMDLERLVTKHGPLPVPRVVHFLEQACASLAEAHERGMVHRDIKPANLFASVMGKQCDILKILDFGTVRRYESADPQLTGTGIVGTPAFMAREQIMNELVDGRTDLYALGCVAYWLLTARLVFNSSSVTALIAQHASAVPDPPSSVSGVAIDPRLEEIVMACLEKLPEDRPSSADELLERLADTRLSYEWNERQRGQWWQRHAELPDRE